MIFAQNKMYAHVFALETEQIFAQNKMLFAQNKITFVQRKWFALEIGGGENSLVSLLLA